MKSALHTLYPERCDQCGRCLRACPRGALKVGAAYIAIDRELCDGCDTCVDACDRDAIVPRVAPVKKPAAAAAAPAKLKLVDVGSRAEAKAMRKAAVAAEKPSAQPRPAGVAPWTLVDVVAVVAIMLAAVLAKNALLGLTALELMPTTARAITRALVLAAYYGAQLGAFAFLARRHASSLLEAFGLRRAHGASEVADKPGALGSAGLVVLLFVATEAFSIAYGLSMDSLGLAQPQRLSSDLSVVFGGGGTGLVLSALLVAIAAPFVEELAFRGVVLSAFKDSWGMWAGILGSSTLYAAFHFSLWMFAPTMVLGIALGWLAVTRRSLVPAIALHVAYNAAAVAAAFWVAR